MVGIVTGQGLGLQSSSALGLGGKGQLGDASFGKAGEQIYVNAANGNLVIRDRDELLIGQGVDAQITRAYNSLGQVAGSHWRPGSPRNVDGLTGTVNTAGSTITRTDWDGSAVVYQYDATRALYVAASGAGPRPTLSFDAAANTWKWNDDGARVTEIYDAAQAGRIVSTTDRDGNAVSYAYNADGLLSLVSTAGGDTITLQYNASHQLVSLASSYKAADGALTTATTTRYAYDALGRLSQVIVDLSPEDNSVADGQVFTTTYAYDGDSDRLASITQSDGSQVSFTYVVAGDGSYRVSSFSQLSDTGVLRTTTLSYANGMTTVTDPLGQVTQLSYDSSGRLTQTSTPMANGDSLVQGFRYDASGQLDRVTDSLGRIAVYTYDARGNLTEQLDNFGNVISRTYDANNRLIRDWAYTLSSVTTDPATGDPVKGTGPTVTQSNTRYVYDANQRLHYTVSAAGRVTEYKYNAVGQQIAAIEYRETFLGSAGGPISEASIGFWLPTVQKSAATRTDTSYDYRGNVATVTRYGALLADGTGMITGVAGDVTTTRYVYDAFGRLLQRYAGDGAGVKVEQNVYDGLGRLLSTLRSDGGVTVYQYDDANRRVAVTYANGLVRTSVYDLAGELVSVSDADGGVMRAQTLYAYDADGRLRMTTDASGGRTIYLYDELGRRVAELSPDGALVEYVYDKGGRLRETVAYATRLSSTAVNALLDANGKPRETTLVGQQQVALTLDNAGVRPASAQEDRRAFNYYDGSDRLIRSVDAAGKATDYVYDGTGQLVRSVVYATKVAASLSDTGTAAISSSADDRATRYFYDADGLLTGQLDAAGYLTEYRYNAAGQRKETIRYGGVVAVSLRQSDLSTMTASLLDDTDIHQFYDYDSRGLLVREIDGEGNVTTYAYDAYGNVAQRMRSRKVDPVLYTGYYQQNLQVTAKATQVNGAWPRLSVYVNGSMAGSITLGADSATYNLTYFGALSKGLEIQFVLADSATRQAVTLQGYALNGTSMPVDGGKLVVTDYSGKQDNAWGATLTANQLLPLWSQPTNAYERIDYQYDAEGRLLASTIYADSGVAAQNSQYVYDTSGRVVREEHDGRVTQYRYDAQGRRIAQLGGEGSAALEALGASATDAAKDAVWDQWAAHFAYDAMGRQISAAEPGGARTLFYYDNAGNLTHKIDNAGEVTAYAYDLFGQLSQTTQYANRLAADTLAGLVGGALTDTLKNSFDALGSDGTASITRWTYDARGAIQRSTDALGYTTDYGYNTFGELTSTRRQIDATHSVETDAAYDLLGRRISSTQDAGGLNLVTRAIYDAFGRVVEEVDANGVHRTRQYDRSGNLVAIADGLGGAVHMTYDAANQLLTRTDANGAVTRYRYDLAAHQMVMTTAEGLVVTTTRNAQGQVVGMVDGAGRSTQYTYDRDGNLTAATTAAGTVTASYDAAGHVLSSTDANGVRTSYGYDAVGRVLTRTVDPDGLKLVTTYAYDASGRVIRETDAAGKVTQTAYDKDGQVLTVIVDPDGLRLIARFAYDGLGRTTRVTEGDSDNPASMANPRITERQYDNAGRLVAVVVAPDTLALTTRYGYDANGNAVSVTDAGGKVTRYVYDAENRLSYTVDPTGAVSHAVYDANGNVVARERYVARIDVSSLPATATTAAVEQALAAAGTDKRVSRYAYDQDQRLRYSLSEGGAMVGLVYDGSGNVVQRQEFGALFNPASFTLADATAAVAQTPPDRLTHYVYDAAGRQRFAIDALGDVTETRYDAAGQAVATVAYAQRDALTAPPSTETMQAWVAGHADAADRQTLSFYDAAGRLAYRADAERHVSAFGYDAAGRVLSTVRYDATFASIQAGMSVAAVAALLNGAAGVSAQNSYDAAGRLTDSTDAKGAVTHAVVDAAGQVVARTVAYGTAQAVQSALVYDDAGRLTQETRAAGTPQAATTRYVYDANGRPVQVIDPRGVRLVTSDDADMLEQRKALGVVSGSLGKSVAQLTAADIAKLLSYYTTTTTYDAAGHATQVASPYGAPDAAGPVYATTTKSYDALGNVVKVVDPRGNAGYFYYNASGQLVMQVDPQGFVTTTDYDSAGNTVGVTRYLSPATGQVDETHPPSVSALGQGARTLMEYDHLGRLTKTTDAQGGVESYAYDSFGNRTQYTNKLGGVSTYAYDHLGHLVSETLPIATTTGAGAAIAVTNTYTYDARGNRIGSVEAVGAAEQRSTTYVYDALDRVVSTVHAAVGTYVAGTGAGTATPTESKTYDLRGNLVASTDANGATTTFYYDAANRLIGQVGPSGTYARFEYDAAGNQVRSLVYGNPVSLPASTTAPPGVPSAAVRELRSTYDAANRLIKTDQPNITVAHATPGANDSLDFEVPITTVSKTWTYDASGQLVLSTDGNGNASRTWYDKLGKAILSIDAEGYGTAWTRDANGNPLQEIRFAARYASDPATITDALATAAAWTRGADDRTTDYTYDLNGRVLTQTLHGVKYGSVDSVGRLTELTGDATTAYAYDAAGNLLRRTDANGNQFSWTFDLAGRNLSSASPSFTDQNGAAVQLRTEYVYNAFNQVLKETQKGASAADDRVSLYQYDAGGRLVAKTNALGITTSMDYDAANHLTRLRYSLTDSAGVHRNQVIEVSYDANGQEVSRLTSLDGNTGVQQRTSYNAYGEVTGRGTGASGWQEYTDYDNAGRVLRSNAGQGITKIYLYDGNGNATMAIESQTADLNAVSVLNSAGVTDTSGIFGTAGLYWTLTVYDKRNQVVDVIHPAMDINGSYLALDAHLVGGSGPGQIGAAVGGAVGPAQSQLPAIDPANALTKTPGSFGSGGVAVKWTQNKMSAGNFSLAVSVADLSSLFGTYDISITVSAQIYSWATGRQTTIVSATTTGYGSGNPPTVSATFPSSFYVGADNVDGQPPSGGYAPGTQAVHFTVTAKVIPRSTGVARDLGALTAQAGLDWGRPASPANGSYNGQFGLSVASMANSIRLSDQDSAQLGSGAMAAQIYVRPWKTGPFVQMPITPGSPATVSLSGLAPSSYYEVVYAAERGDGSIVRCQQYQVYTDASSGLNGIWSVTEPALQMFGGGAYMITDKALVGMDMRTANGTRVSWASFAYRPRGSNAAWAWAKDCAGIAYGSTSMSLVGVPPGDYEINLWMFDSANNAVQMLEGRLVMGADPSILLNYPRPADNALTLTNLPATATTATVTLTSGGQQFSSGPLSISTPGSLAWNLPQAVFDASGASTTWAVSVSMSDGRVEPPTNYTATGSVVVGYGRPSGQPPITVQGNLYTLTFDPRDTSSQPIAAGQALLLRYWPDGADIANHPELIQRRIISKGPDGKYQWDSLGLDPNTSYTYYYDVYATLDQARTGDSAVSLNRTGGHFKPQNAANAGQGSRWVISNIHNSQVTVHRRQTHNAFGEVVSETDGRGNTTTLQYNTAGQLTAKIDPQVTVTYGNGYQTRVSPQTAYVYDRLGQLVGTRDANGNLSTQRWNDALGKVVTEFHADNGVVVYQYDALGDQRVKVESLDIGSVGAASARRTDYTYDKGARLVRVDRPAVNGQRAYDVYVYDELDRRVSHSSLLGTDTVDYDIEGNVSRVVSAAGRTTTYTTVWNASLNGGQGGWVKTTTLPYNLNSSYAEDKVVRTQIDQSDVFGRALQHTDLGGRTTSFLYYNNGLLKQQGSTSYTYYNNGLMRTMTDGSTGIRGSYEYDNNGNKTFEGFTGQNGQWAFQQSVSTYDELNRLVKVVDPRYTIDYEYDAMGNRIHMKSVYTDGMGTPGQVQDYWYAYDTMNRFTTTMGQLKDGRRGTAANDATAYVGRGSSGDGVTIGYDAFNERVSATYASDGHTESYAYDGQGYLTTTTITNSSGVRTGKATRVNDLSGRVTDYAEYGATDATVIRSITHTWDADSLLLQDRDNVKTTQSTTVGTRTERLADGTVKATQTFGEATTMRTTYDYVWYDSAKQSRIQTQASNQSAPGWAPGLSTFNYDANGRLTSAYDVAGSRGFKYQLDGEGHILQRDELLGGTYDAGSNSFTGAYANRMHSYYYLDGQQIGNVGNDGPERIDYAQELARNAAANANRDATHQRFAPVAFADFDSNYQPINSQYPGDAPGSYIVQSGDTLTGIALALWGDSSLWWMLADANNLTLDTPLPPNTVLTVPNKVTNIHNNSATFRPYDAGRAIGNTQPTLPDAPPPPPSPGHGKKGCGGVLQVVAIAVAVVATIYTAGAAAGLLSVSATAGATTFSAGVAVLGGSAGLSAAAIGAAAIGGAVGSIAAQSVLIAGGEQNGFNWKGVAMGAIGAAVTAGIGAANPGGISLASRINSATNGGVIGQVAQGAVRGAVTDALGSVTGAQAFSWKDVAASAVSSGAGYGSGQLAKNWNPVGSSVANGVSAGVASGVVRGNLSDSWAGIARDVIGSTMGNTIADRMAGHSFDQASRQESYLDGIDPRQQVLDDVAAEDLRVSGQLPDIQLSSGEVKGFTTKTEWPYKYVDSWAINRNDGVAEGVDYTYTFRSRDQARGIITDLVAEPEQSYRSLSDTDAFFTFNPAGQVLKGIGDRVNGIVNTLITPGLPKAAVMAATSHYQAAYRDGTLGDTVLRDAGTLLHQTIMSSPIGLVKALNERDKMGGMYELGGSLFDAAIFVAPIAGERVLAEGGDLLQAGGRGAVSGAREELVAEARAQSALLKGKYGALSPTQRTARIDELSRLNYERRIGEAIDNQEYVFRYLSADSLASSLRYGTVRGYTTTEFSHSSSIVASRAQVLPAWGVPEYGVAIPVDKLNGFSIARPMGNKATTGWEAFTNSYPQAGAGGWSQFLIDPVPVDKVHIFRLKP